MKFGTAVLVVLITNTSASTQFTTWKQPEPIAQLYNAKQSNPDTTPDIRRLLNEELEDENIGGPIPYLTARTPLRSETLPEMKKSSIWRRWFNFSVNGPSKKRYASGYDVELITRPGCDPNPFKGDCYGGSFSSFVNAPDKKFFDDIIVVKHEPLTEKSIPLSYNVNGYFWSGGIKWVYKQGLYVMNGIDYPIESVILANASSPDLKDPRGPNYNKPFAGTISKNLKVNMQLRRSGKWLWGTYFYDKDKPVPLQDRLYIVGTVGKDGSATLKEYAFDNAENSATQSGTFKGKLNDKTFSGTWSAPKGQPLPFQLAAK